MDKIDSLMSTELQEARIAEENLRIKIADVTRIRDDSIGTRSLLIKKALKKIRKLESRNAALNQQYEEMENKGGNADLKLNKVLQQIEELKSRKKTGIDLFMA